MGFLWISAIYRCISAHYALGKEKNADVWIFSGNNSQERISLSFRLQLFRDQTTQRHNRGVLELYAGMIIDLFSGMCRQDLALMQWLFSHHVLWAVPYGHPSVTVVAHHDLVGGHPVAPATHIRDTVKGRDERKCSLGLHLRGLVLIVGKQPITPSHVRGKRISDISCVNRSSGQMFCSMMLLFQFKVLIFSVFLYVGAFNHGLWLRNTASWRAQHCN